MNSPIHQLLATRLLRGWSYPFLSLQQALPLGKRFGQPKRLPPAQHKQKPHHHCNFLLVFSLTSRKPRWFYQLNFTSEQLRHRNCPTLPRQAKKDPRGLRLTLPGCPPAACAQA